MDDLWIWVPNWFGDEQGEGFQHYRDRDPIWIKNYTRLLSHDAYADLSFHRRGILHGTWMAYATSARRIRGETLTMTRRLGQKVTRADIEALNHAGFLELVASTVLAQRLQDASPRARPRGRERREVLRTSLRERASARASTSGSRSHAQEEEGKNSRPPSGVCPFCETGGGYHAAGCPAAGEPE